MSVSREIEEARSLLERADRETNPSLKAQLFEEAIELLDSCAAEDISPSEKTLIGNLRVSYTRRLLSQLASLEAVQFEVWFNYIKLLFFELDDEVARVVADDPNLKENYNRFVRLWRQELLEALGEK